ncbi:Fatty acid synthase subunit alpha [Aspergillus mulundensis]|uniref:Fatty acid synthase subunit alpha n=1 Tax=Aspergillus mulundensis TaxID=1810919 RepID=A0A3D8SLF1_9EURO|nr:Fatty acid synthase subunit alpha [Aspergillus mulundensis]RDW87106.1 Fatty acid synthase subunit alpha [Aspergillus mulundensis]
MAIPTIVDIAPTIERRPGEKELGLKLFIELLSYQLASPVRWVETQQQLSRGESSIQRFVEIGPRTILSTMAKKSANIESNCHPSINSSNPEFLSYHDNRPEIMYYYEQNTGVDPVSRPIDTLVKNTSSPSLPKRHLSPPKAFPTSAIPSADLSLQTGHVLLAMTAQKLGRRFDQVSLEKSIRDLSGGKSTLQNELTGDLVAEFGRVPEGVEDKSLSSLAETFNPEFSGAPGKAMSVLISRLLSSKMPAGFHQSDVQDYLNNRWGLTRSHAYIPLCFATTMEPAVRLSSADEARAYLDNLVQKYASFQGISLLPTSPAFETHESPARAVLDVAELNEFKKRNSELHRSYFNSLAKYLDIDYRDSERTFAGSEARISDLESIINLLNAELDEQFIEGIKPMFSLKQAREYDSWWNWSREGLIRLLHEICKGPSSTCPPNMESRLQSLLNRWDTSCSDIAFAQLAELRLSFDAHSNELQPILEEIISLGTEALSIDPIFVHNLPPMRPQTAIADTGHLEYREIPRHIEHYSEIIAGVSPCASDATASPFIHIKTRSNGEDWRFDPKATSLYHAMLDVGVTTGFTFANKAVLVTGAGPSSIAASAVQGLLSGGARIIVTTSRSISQSSGFYQNMYRRYGAKGSSLTVLPFNQASKQDCEKLVQHIYGPNSPTMGDLDYVLPFAAIPQAGEPDALGGRQELSLRAMLVNILRLLGFIRREKERLRIETRPTMVILPMSCNEGTFGGDGLYSESKIGLKGLFNRFFSESWSNFLTVCGAVIGWTRGTALMQSSNIVAEEVEKLGVLTFTQQEMAFNILSLMTPALTALAEDAPIYADLTGGLGSMWNVKKDIADARKRLSQQQALQTAIAEDDARERALGCATNAKAEAVVRSIRRARLGLPFPPLSDIDESYPNLKGMVDLTRVPVIVGYSELGPWGNARTRWDIEHQGEFSLEGYIEMAWIMGLIKHVDGQVKGEPYVGWVDAGTQTPIQDDQVPEKYHKHIMAHAGLRLIKPTKLDNYDPSRKELLHEVAVEEDLAPFETSRLTAEAFKLRHGDCVTLQLIPDTDNCRVHIRKGAVLMIPKAVPFDQVVAGRIPEGWDPARYGIPEDIIQQVDVTTLYALCCVSEAFLSAGIKDPYEMYQHIHVSELANCLGSGGGPMKVIQSMYRDRFLDRQMRGDIILEHFVNTMGAWVNMLLLSATGPLKTPVGACATAIESLDIGCEAIQTGKCKVAVVGGCDDYGEELAFEFANIKATANSTEELSKGRTPSDISRPTASSRSGFAESAGCGVQVLMSAALAIEMGLPIYGVVAYTHMASDQIGRSIPAPGKGILTAARETSQAQQSPLLDLSFRRAAFDAEVTEIHNLTHKSVTTPGQDRSGICNTASLRISDAKNRWSNNIRLSDPSISPIRASLATWGLTIDDIKVVSMHGTSTKANEVNEGDVINTQMRHLGRRKGNPLLAVCQKSLTGHPKAGAGAWQLNGCLQMMQERIVPGNRNADNIDSQLRQFEHLVYPMESMRVPEVKATLLTSFGFGQKGAINIMVSPRYLFASLSKTQYEDYRTRTTTRQRSATPTFVSRMLKNNLVQVKTRPPWNDPDAMRDFFLDPTSRVVDGQISHACEKSDIPEAGSPSASVEGTLHAMIGTLNRSSPASSVGVDVEEIANINIDNPVFISRNFTPAEREYCQNAPDPRASFTGRWAAKEAVFKSMQTTSAGAGAAMNQIEILNVEGIPSVAFHGQAQVVAMAKGITNVEITISHCNDTAIAVALAVRKSE